MVRILARLLTMARPNSPAMPPKHTKKVRLGIKMQPTWREKFIAEAGRRAVLLSNLAAKQFLVNRI